MRELTGKESIDFVSAKPIDITVLHNQYTNHNERDCVFDRCFYFVCVCVCVKTIIIQKREIIKVAIVCERVSERECMRV